MGYSHQNLQITMIDWAKFLCVSINPRPLHIVTPGNKQQVGNHSGTYIYDSDCCANFFVHCKHWCFNSSYSLFTHLFSLLSVIIIWNDDELYHSRRKKDEEKKRNEHQPSYQMLHYILIRKSVHVYLISMEFSHICNFLLPYFKMKFVLIVMDLLS